MCQGHYEDVYTFQKRQAYKVGARYLVAQELEILSNARSAYKVLFLTLKTYININFKSTFIKIVGFLI